MSAYYALLADYELKLHTQRYFHVAIARVMEVNNMLAKENQEEVHTLAYMYMVQALYPFVPHLASELWENMQDKVVAMGFDQRIERQEWDNIAKLMEESSNKVKIRVSLDGKFLGIVEVGKEMIGDAEMIF